MKQLIVKCKVPIEKHNTKRDCGRFLFKIVNKKQIHAKCPSCGSYAIVSVSECGELVITHIKEGEEILCQKA